MLKIFKNNKKFVVGLFVMVMMSVPFSVSAMTTAEMLVQIQSLMQMVQQLQAQLVQRNEIITADVSVQKQIISGSFSFPPAAGAGFLTDKKTGIRYTFEKSGDIEKMSEAMKSSKDGEISVQINNVTTNIFAGKMDYYGSGVKILQDGASVDTVLQCASFAQDMWIGKTDAQTGGEVSKLQNFLVKQGVYPEAIISGYYGMLTAKAVVRWQHSHGLVFTTARSGVGSLTRKSIKDSCVYSNR